MAWLVESWAQQRARAALPGQLLALDFDDLLADLAGGMCRVLAHLGLPHDAATVDRVAAQPVAWALRQGTGPGFHAEDAGQTVAGNQGAPR
jgi:hypothetical protein